MNSVFFPVHVVVVLRRIVNVLSSLSISNQYLLLKKANADEVRARASELGETPRTSYSDTGAANPPQTPSRQTFDALGWAGNSWWALRARWDWPRIVLLEGMSRPTYHDSLADTTAGANTISLPWIGKSRPWSSLVSSLARNSGLQGGPSPHPDHQRGGPSGASPKPPPPETERDPASLDIIHQLMRNPALHDPLRTPRYPIVLCHGLYGFDSRGPLKFPSMRMHYWSNVLNILRDTVKAEVIVTSVPGTGSITERSASLDHQLQQRARGRGINLLAHSMGGLDCRHLISHVKPAEYAPLSLTTISTPHRGSPFMDWCAENIGIGKLRQQERDLAKSRNLKSPPHHRVPPAVALPPPVADEGPGGAGARQDTPFSLSFSSLPSSFTTLLLSIVDSPAYANLTSAYLNDVFNPATPDDPRVKYFSVAGRMAGVSVWHPFWLPKMVLDGVEEKHRGRLRAIWEDGNYEGASEEAPLWAREREWGNDGLVTVQSAKWGEFLGIMEGCDHWEMRGARGIEFGVDLPALPAIGLGVSTAGHRNANGDGWGLRDWGRFVGAWKKEEKIQRDAAAKAAGGGPMPKPQSTPEEREREREQRKESDDVALKLSTDKLSAVFDWLTDQVPSPTPLLDATGTALAGAKARMTGDGASPETKREVSEMQKHMDREEKGRRKNELAAKSDLERFYVALSKKMYDEGL